MRGENCIRFINVSRGYWRGQIFFYKRLQAEEESLAVYATTGFDIAGYELGTLRVLSEVRGFVRIGIQNQVFHDGAPPVVL